MYFWLSDWTYYGCLWTSWKRYVQHLHLVYITEGWVIDGRLRGVDVEGNTGRNQTFASMFRTPHCMKLYDNVVFMVSFRREKGSSLTGMYFVIKIHFKYVHERVHVYVWSFILSTLWLSSVQGSFQDHYFLLVGVASQCNPTWNIQVCKLISLCNHVKCIGMSLAFILFSHALAWSIVGEGMSQNN